MANNKTDQSSPPKPEDQSNLEEIRQEISNLKINIAPSRKPNLVPDSGTVLIVRDLPPDVTSAELLALFPPRTQPSTPNTSDASDASDSPPFRDEVLSLHNEFGSNWALLFANESRCVAAAIFLQTKSLRGSKVHARVMRRPKDTERPISREFNPTPSPARMPPLLINYAESEPIFYSLPSSSLSPIISPAPNDFLLDNIMVPDGVFADNQPIIPRYNVKSPAIPGVPVSPMQPILGQSPLMRSPPNNIYMSSANSSERVQKQYRKMLRMKQRSLDQTKMSLFPSKSSRPIAKGKVAALLKELSKESFPLPDDFKSDDGKLRYFVRAVVCPEVHYGEPLRLSNPNDSHIQKLD